MEKPWWFPQITNQEYCDRLRKDYPEGAKLSNDELIDIYANGRKYAVLWDHIGDAYEEYEKLADAYIDLLKTASQQVVAPDQRKLCTTIGCNNYIDTSPRKHCNVCLGR